MSNLPNRVPDDRPLQLTAKALVWRDGEEGCEYPMLLRALVAPGLTMTHELLFAAIASGSRLALTHSELVREFWRDSGESLSLLDLADNPEILAMVVHYAPGLSDLSFEYLEPADIDVDENLAAGLIESALGEIIEDPGDSDGDQ